LHHGWCDGIYLKLFVHRLANLPLRLKHEITLGTGDLRGTAVVMASLTMVDRNRWNVELSKIINYKSLLHSHKSSDNVSITIDCGIHFMAPLFFYSQEMSRVCHE